MCQGVSETSYTLESSWMHPWDIAKITLDALIWQKKYSEVESILVPCGKLVFSQTKNKQARVSKSSASVVIILEGWKVIW